MRKKIAQWSKKILLYTLVVSFVTANVAMPITVYGEDVPKLPEKTENFTNSSDSVPLTIPEKNPDTVAPIVTLVGEQTISLEAGIDTYNELGATCFDNIDGDCSPYVIISGDEVNTLLPGTYTILYDYSDWAQNPAIQMARTVIVQDTTPPVFPLLEKIEVITKSKNGLSKNDLPIPDVQDNVAIATIENNAPEILDVDTIRQITWTAVDTSGNSNTATQMVEITYVNMVPVANDDSATTYKDAPITIDVLGNDTDGNEDPLTIISYTQPLQKGINPSVPISAGTTELVSIEGIDGKGFLHYEPKSNFIETVSFNYTIDDGNGNQSIGKVLVSVIEDTIPPVITLNGLETITITQGDTYIDAGATARDENWGETKVTTYNPVDSNVPGTYTVTYSAIDPDNNKSQATRTVIVEKKPVSGGGSYSGGGGSSTFSPRNVVVEVLDGFINGTWNAEETSTVDYVKKTVSVRITADQGTDLYKVTHMALNTTNDFSTTTFTDYQLLTEWYYGDTTTGTVWVQVKSATGGILTISAPYSISAPRIVEGDKIANCKLEIGKPYKYVSDPGIWVITDACTRRAFKNEALYKSYFTSWNDIIVVEKNVLESILKDSKEFMPWGPLYNPQYGAIVQTDEDPTIYAILGNKRNSFESTNVFDNLRYPRNWIEDVSKDFLDKYDAGVTISSTDRHSDFTIIKYENSPAVYQIVSQENGISSKKYIENEQAFEKAGFRWDRIMNMIDSEIYPTVQ